MDFSLSPEEKEIRDFGPAKARPRENPGISTPIYFAILNHVNIVYPV